MPTPVKTQGQAFKTPIMQIPEEPLFIPVVFDFTTDPAQVLTKDFLQELQNLKLPFIQTVYIDNSGDANSLIITFNDDGLYTITVKGRTQGFYPVLVPAGVVKVTVTSTGSAIKKTISFLSMMVPPVQWVTA